MARLIATKPGFISIICFSACISLCLAQYRSYDGTGNNVANPQWGAGSRPFRRVLPAEYCPVGGAAAPRCSKVNNAALPSARVASHMLLQIQQASGSNTVPDVPDSKRLTSLHMAFGQFLAHDAGLSRPATNATQQSCNAPGTYTPGRRPAGSSECFHIPVKDGDPVYNTRTHPFLPFVRDQRQNKEQINIQTSWIDLSLVYGSESTIRDNLLEDPGQSAKLKLRPPPNFNGQCSRQGILPQCEDGSCEFDAGDPRVPEQVQLTAFHTIFVREHNRLVNELSSRHKDWNVKKRLQEARKINIAQWQHIVYNEYVPILLGKSLPKGAKLRKNGFSTDYDPKIDPTTTNEFMTASFRFGHTQIQLEVELADEDYESISNITFDKIFFNTSLVLAGKIDEIIFGAIKQDAEKSDDLFNRIITSKFKVKGREMLGEDLVALDIQRGRDHGLPGYNDWRKEAKLAALTPKQFQKYSSVYDDADDVDLFVGAMDERPVRKGLVGSTFASLLADHFTRFRRGDRFWYERQTMFNRRQLKELKKVTLARLLCDNLDKMKTVQKRPMELSKRRLKCSKIPRPNYALF